MSTSNASTTKSKKSTTRTTSSSSYTESLAYDPQRLRLRTTIPKLCLLNIAPKSSLLDKTLGLLSIVTASIWLVGMCIGMIVIIVPSVIFTKVWGITNYFNTGSSKANINVSKIGKGSVTAIKTLSARSQMYIIGGGPDELAPILMKRTSLFGADLPGSTFFSHVMLFVFRINFYLTGRIINDQIGYLIDRYYFPFRIGEVSYLQVRTCWLDDCIESFVRKNLDGTTGKANVNVVILGAGYDSRCYRLNLTERGVQTYEVDTTGTQAEKLRVLQQSNILTTKNNGTTKFVSCDFESEDWLTRLRDCGFDSNLPTLCVWEGVTMYLDRNVILSTISKIGTDLGVGSCIAFDYVDASWALSPMLIKFSTKGGEPWKFGMEFPSSSSSSNNDDDDVHEKDVIVSKLVSDCNDDLKVLDHLRHEELIKRYLPTHYDGRPIGYLGDFGGLLLIGKLE